MSARASARPHHRRSVAALLAGAVVASSVSILVASAPAQAVQSGPTPSCSATAATCTLTYDYTGSLDTFTVPESVTSVGLDVFGAQGGARYPYSGVGGEGGRTTGTLAVTPGQVLTLLVGQAGANPGAASYGGGGAVTGALDGRETYLGSGGGGSFAFTSDGGLLAASGGGGGGGEELAGGAGAGAGDSGADGGVESFWLQLGSTPAGGGTQDAGGVAGYNANHDSRGANGVGPAGDFGPGAGGDGGDSRYNPYFSGAGGGGGYYGGGGGGAFHGGAGGSGYAAPSMAAVTAQTGVQAGNGEIAVSYDRPAPEVVLAASPPANSTEGDAVTVTATVTSSIATATSTVAFTEDGTAIPGCGAVALDSSRQATCTTSDLPPGTRSLAATYAGDGVLAPSTSAPSTFDVAYRPLALTTTTLPGATVGQPYSTQLTAQDGLAPYTWSVSQGALPPGLSLSSSGLLSGTPTSVGTQAPVTFEVQDAQGTPYVDTLALALPIARGDQQPGFTSELPTDIRVGGTHELVASDGGSGEPRQYATGSGTTNDACAVDGSTVSFDHVGWCEVVATQPATSSWNAGSASELFAVEAKQSEVVVTLSDHSPAYGHTVTGSATSSAAGTLQWALAGSDLGAAVAVAPGTPVEAPALWSASSLPDSGSAYEVTATFVPADPTVDGATVGRDSFAVSRAGSAMALAVVPDSLSATVRTDASGDLGVPSGEVTFLIDNQPVGTAPLVAPTPAGTVFGLLPAPVAPGATATLPYVVPASSSHHVTAVYGGDDNYTGASASTQRDDPLLSASVTSARPASHGWYRTPVRVTFTCTPAGAPLVGGCPAPVLLSDSGAGQSVSRTVLAQDGGAATVSVAGLDVDRVAPSVRILGHGRRARCLATDSLSGVSGCTLHRTKGRRSRLVATAVDRAGNVAVTGVRVGPGITILRAPRQHGRFVVHSGRTYTVVTWGPRRPTLLAATPAIQRPRDVVRSFRGVGHGRWVVRMRFAAGTSGNWALGVRTAGLTKLVQVRITG